MNRVHNFSAGPAALPRPVLLKAQEELTDYRGAGRSIMEMSHRGQEYTEIHNSAVDKLKRIIGADDQWHVLFLQGGASSQFMMVPHNFLNSTRTADYIDTGTWSSKAIKEAKLFGNVHVPFFGKERRYTHIPAEDELTLSSDAAYLHFTSNNTIYGTQFSQEPKTNAPLVCDASSDFLSRPMDLNRYGLIYAGAQKNLGPAGVTVVLIHKSFAEKQRSEPISTILDYKTHISKIFNTPPVFAVYLLNYVLDWIEEKGGINYFESYNSEKSDLLYSEIDKDDFYRGTADKKSRSKMNVTFRLANSDLEKQFLLEAEKQNLVALKGHRSVGGIRASIYNACEIESVKALVSFMNDFRKVNG